MKETIVEDIRGMNVTIEGGSELSRTDGQSLVTVENVSIGQKKNHTEQEDELLRLLHLTVPFRTRRTVDQHQTITRRNVELGERRGKTHIDAKVRIQFER